MPTIVNCPTCHRPLTVHESQVGQAVNCPNCRHPLTVPALVPRQPADPFAGLPAPEPELSGETRRAVGARGYRAGQGGWPGEPPGWLIAARMVIWGLIAVPSLIILVLLIIAAISGVVTSETVFSRMARASEVVIAVGVAFALDRLLSANRY
ncbi:MAG: hypothetical protein JWO38_1760 [Gemmataceae bacterium]|nr:hypothetical protein [Gemmataceae bacterium]